MRTAMDNSNNASPCFSTALRRLGSAASRICRCTGKSSNGGATGRPQDGAARQESVLDMGFARATLRTLESPGWPAHEVLLETVTRHSSDLGIQGLVEFLLCIAALPEVDDGFVLTYCVRSADIFQQKLVSEIARVSLLQENHVRWSKCCRCWRVVSPHDLHDRVKQLLIGSLVHSTRSGLSCPVYLITQSQTTIAPNADNLVSLLRNARSVSAEHDGSEEIVNVFTAFVNEFLGLDEPESLKDAGPKKRPSIHIGAAAFDPVFYEYPAFEESPPSPRPAPPAIPLVVEQSNWKNNGLPSSVDMRFVTVSQGFDSKSKLGFLKVIGHDSEISDDAIEQLLAFYDAFLATEHASRGFSITYDLRLLRTPSMSMILRVAEWGSHPDRKEQWERLNKVCKVVITSGFRYSVSRAALSAFFAVCPPVCTTYLLTDPDDPEEDAVCFQPAHRDAAEDIAEVPLARQASDRSLEGMKETFKEKLASEFVGDLQQRRASLKDSQDAASVVPVEELRVWQHIDNDFPWSFIDLNGDPHAWVHPSDNFESNW